MQKRSSLEKLLAMIVPIFVDLQGFIVKRKFVVKEVAVLRQRNVLSHYIFTNPIPWDALLKSEKSCVSWLTAYHHGLRWEDGTVSYWMARDLITKAVYGMMKNDDNDSNDDDDEDLVYVKGHEKR